MATIGGRLHTVVSVGVKVDGAQVRVVVNFRGEKGTRTTVVGTCMSCCPTFEVKLAMNGWIFTFLHDSTSHCLTSVYASSSAKIFCSLAYTSVSLSANAY